MNIFRDKESVQDKSPPDKWGPSRAFTFRCDLGNDNSWWCCIPCRKYVCDTHLRCDKHRKRIENLDYYLEPADSTCLQQTPQSQSSLSTSAWHSFRSSALFLASSGVYGIELSMAAKRAARDADKDAEPRHMLADLVPSVQEGKVKKSASSHSETDEDARSGAGDSDEHSSPSARQNDNRLAGRRVRLIPRGSLRPEPY